MPKHERMTTVCLNLPTTPYQKAIAITGRNELHKKMSEVLTKAMEEALAEHKNKQDSK